MAEENVDNGADETVQWTLTDHVNALTAHWTDQLNTVRDISARHNPGYCQLRPTNGVQCGRKAGQRRFGGGKGATTVVNHLIYDAFGRVTSENKNLSEKVNIGVIPRTHFGFRIGSNPATGDIFFFNNCPLLVSNSLFVFTGRPFDSDTQLQNNLNRWYDARVGRWLSEDPIGFSGGDGNLYRYVGNAAIFVRDPTALSSLPNLSDLWEPIIKMAERRRGHGSWRDSAQHCWPACYLGAVYGVGNLAAIVADVAEHLDPSSDSQRDICAQHRGAYFGHQFSWLRIFTLGAKPEMTAGEWCDMSCDTWAR